MIQKIKNHKIIFIILLVGILGIVALLFYPLPKSDCGTIRDSNGNAIGSFAIYCYQPTNNFQKILNSIINNI